MKSKLKAVCLTLAAVAVVVISGCGSSNSGNSAAPASDGTSTPPPAAVSTEAAALYAANCADCHGALDVSTKKGITVARLQNAIANNTGGMGSLSALSAAQQQTIVSALTPAATTPTPTPTPTTDGAALYAANCAGCHGALATSSKKGATAAQIQSRMDAPPFASRVLTSAEVQAIAAVLVVTTPTPTPAPAPAPTTDGATLYADNCADCHGTLASSGKKGTTLARLQNAITGNTGNMGFLSTLTGTQQQAIVTALAPATPTPAPTPNPTPTPTPVTDGATLYANNCAGCHGALASSGKAGATAARTQTAINNNTGGMGSLSSLTATQVAAIATSLAVVTPSPTPTPTPSCGSCHAIPPATGEHAFHTSQRVACATCHGSGYSTTAVNAATHNNGVKNLTTTIGWNATSRSCANSCHGRNSW